MCFEARRENNFDQTEETPDFFLGGPTFLQSATLFLLHKTSDFVPTGTTDPFSPLWLYSGATEPEITFNKPDSNQVSFQPVIKLLAEWAVICNSFRMEQHSSERI